MFIITAQSEAKQNAFHVEFFSRLQVRLMPIRILFSLSQAFGDLFRSSLDFMFHGRCEVVVLPGLCFESNFSLQAQFFCLKLGEYGLLIRFQIFLFNTCSTGFYLLHFESFIDPQKSSLLPHIEVVLGWVQVFLWQIAELKFYWKWI